MTIQTWCLTWNYDFQRVTVWWEFNRTLKIIIVASVGSCICSCHRTQEKALLEHSIMDLRDRFSMFFVQPECIILIRGTTKFHMLSIRNYRAWPGRQWRLVMTSYRKMHRVKKKINDPPSFLTSESPIFTSSGSFVQHISLNCNIPVSELKAEILRGLMRWTNIISTGKLKLVKFKSEPFYFYRNSKLLVLLNFKRWYLNLLNNICLQVMQGAPGFLFSR